jgi:hypothetical protein
MENSRQASHAMILGATLHLEEVLVQRRRDYLALAFDITRQAVPAQHEDWIRDACRKQRIPEITLLAQYLLERYHRPSIWLRAEALATVLLYTLHRTLGTPKPDLSLGICQIRMSWWREAAASDVEDDTLGTNVLSLIDDSLRSALVLMDEKTCIEAAAGRLRYVLKGAESSIQCACCLARLLVGGHFGYPEHRDDDSFGISDLLCFVIRVLNGELTGSDLEVGAHSWKAVVIESPNACSCWKKHRRRSVRCPV